MPIRPENKHRYPREWLQIRERILERAGHCCERCGLANYLIGYRDAAGEFHELPGMQAETYALDGGKTLQIVLTIAHWPVSDPECCEDWNLWSLCQRCHLRLDRDHHAMVAAENRRKKRERWQPALLVLPDPARAGK